MPITRPIPDSCKAVVERIRREVPVPSEDPTMFQILSYMGRPIGNPCPRFKTGEKFSKAGWFNGCCPLGLLPDATEPSPFPDDPAMQDFANWWDEQTDPIAAKNEVWGVTNEGG